ncbi:MKL/myocardin-like protein 2 [Ceratocystis fimbriata CBS 114723]|uniref:MKL/myocardin-like protein 2 n=2 Tax=Ceratocystis TaxID=5157 RepID=A0A0F8B0S3_CERFI|nr:MKL/myocardin-like protein 2 [Ceratocystis platani]PHH54724.1 MKL/myocardin-like protein 2 [Ceratocystis fimbriata CBS 114723]
MDTTAPIPTVDDSHIVASPERKNSLDNYLQHRPTRDSLVNKNILPPTTAAPAIQAHQMELQKSMRADTLNEKISHRPSPDTLLKSGVLANDPRIPSDDEA